MDHARAGKSRIEEWATLSWVEGIGPRLASVLIERFGSPEAALRAADAELMKCGLSEGVVRALKSGDARRLALDELGKLRDLSASAISLGDPGYPALLREIYDPPVVVYVRGDHGLSISQPCIAIVGSRHCSTYGRNAAQRLGYDLAAHGVTIVSGLARGVDTAAHEGALSAGGRTIAVLGTGIDQIYPKENRKLADRIVSSGGSLLTEFKLGTPPTSQNFPYRNRIISGLSHGVLVVEGAERSGSLITARLAYEQGREVFALPGNITSSKSFGPNYLIKDGAKLVQTWRDVVEELPREDRERILAAERQAPGQKALTFGDGELSEPERKVFKMLSCDEPLHIDRLMSSSGLAPAEIFTVLLSLELKDKIQELPGKAYVRKM